MICGLFLKTRVILLVRFVFNIVLVMICIHFFFREERYEFIRSKYVEKKFAIRTCSDEADLINDLEHAVTSKHLFQLLQAFVEGVDLTSVLPNSVSFI